MIAGVVNAAREAIVSLHLVGIGGRDLKVEAILDTGFNHDLTLPTAIIEALDLEFVSPGEATVAGDLVVAANFYRAHLIWEGRRRRTSVLEMEGAPLLGMGFFNVTASRSTCCLMGACRLNRSNRTKCSVLSPLSR